MSFNEWVAFTFLLVAVVVEFAEARLLRSMLGRPNERIGRDVAFALTAMVSIALLAF